YFDAPVGGHDITTAVTAAAGWTTPGILAPGTAVELGVLVTPDYGGDDGATKVLKITATGGVGTVPDVVVAQTTLTYQLLKLQFSLDAGATWSDAPSGRDEFNSVVVMAVEGRSLGIRAVKRHPELPWPRSNEFPYITPGWSVANGDDDELE